MGIWLEALIRTGTISSIGARFITKDQRRVPILFSRTAIKDENGESVGAIGIDFEADYVREFQKSIRDQIVLAFLVTYLTLFVLVFLVSRICRLMLSFSRTALRVLPHSQKVQVRPAMTCQ